MFYQLYTLLNSNFYHGVKFIFHVVFSFFLSYHTIFVVATGLVKGIKAGLGYLSGTSSSIIHEEP